MAEPIDPARYVPQAATAVGLTLAAGDIDGVVQAFAVLARVAAPVMAFALPQDMIPAALFLPVEGEQP